MRDLIFVGGGEHARVVIDAADGAFRLIGFVDPQPCPATQALGVPWLGADDAHAISGGALYVVTVGPLPGSKLRGKIISAYEAKGASFATIVHPRATVSPRARLADGVVILAGAIVNAGAIVGAHAVVNTAAVLEHDVEVGPLAHVAPGAVVGGGARIGAGAYLGLGCRIRDHVTVGRDAIVAMGAVVTAPVSDDSTVLGVPARERASR